MRILTPSLRLIARHQRIHATVRPHNFPTRCLSTAAHRITVETPNWSPGTTTNFPNTTNHSTSRRRDWRTASPKHQGKQEVLRRLQPQKYNSLVYLPGTATLQYPKSHNQSSFALKCLDFAIAKPGKGGGHALLARNGGGKSLVVQYLTTLNDNDNSELLLKTNDDNANVTNNENVKVAHVSFDSHLQMVQQEPHLTVHDAITGGTGNLSKAAQYLVVRFGLKPLLHRTLGTLSTGEIRKALLVSALSREPELLVLENAFDGLDTASRQELKSIVSKTMTGLSQSGKLLVTHVQANAVPPAQVLLSTHRPEEIVDEITTMSYVVQDDDHNNNLVTVQRPTGWSQEQLMYTALGLHKDHNKNQTNWSTLQPWQIEDPTLPTIEQLQQVWESHDNKQSTPSNPLMSLDNVEIRRYRDGVTADDELNGNKEDKDEVVTLLQPLSWQVQPGERWVLHGGNGAGKSTLSRFLLQHNNSEENDYHDVNDNINKDTTCDLTFGTYSKDPATTVGWVSTESHLAKVTTGSDEDTVETAWDVITHNGAVSEAVAKQFVPSVFGAANDREATKTESMLQETPLDELSQGQQKLALIASALALRPQVLILDEPTQGLDWVNRNRVLTLLERLCQATDTSLIYITHYQQEWIPSISHVLHLEKGHVLYQGPKKDFDGLGEKTL